MRRRLGAARKAALAGLARCLYNRIVRNGCARSRAIVRRWFVSRCQDGPFKMVRLLTPTDFRSMPWKNGAGRTTEIAVHPAGAGLDAFAWRVSIANVECDGPFSAFPGIDRTIVLLDGAGMRLQDSEREIDLTTRYEPQHFRGDDSIDCKLVSGPCRDFNAMFRRGRARGSVTIVRRSRAEFDPPQFCVSYAAKGPHEATIARRGARRLDEGDALVAVESVSAAEGGSIVVRPLADDAVAIVVCVDYR